MSDIVDILYISQKLPPINTITTHSVSCIMYYDLTKTIGGGGVCSSQSIVFGVY